MLQTASPTTEHSPYVYDRAPSFKRAPSALDIKAVDANSTFYGNLVVSCTGQEPCYSKFSKLLLRICQGVSTSSDDDDTKASSMRWSDDDKMTIRGALWTKTEKLRIYFISLLENTEMSDKYRDLYVNLSNEKYKVSDDKSSFILDAFACMVRRGDEQILQCLANFKCTQQTRPLWTELQDNNVEHELLNDPQAILDKVDEVRRSPVYQDLSSKGIELDDNEILAIYIYTSNDEFADLMQKHRKLPCKWKQTFYFFVRGVLKIYDCKVYNQPLDKLPSDLYHPTFLSFNSPKGVPTPLPLLSTINCTSSKSAAQDFAPPDGSMFVFKDCARALSKGDLIAAPINWISPHPSEDEWVILPCTLIECEKPKKYVHNALLINSVRYKSINPQLLGVDVFTKLSNLKFIRDVNPLSCSIPSSPNAAAIKDMQYYVARCSQLEAEVQLMSQKLLKTSQNLSRTAEKTENKKAEIRIPFQKIINEAYLITDASKPNCSMCVTSCDGELNPPFISSKGITWLKDNFEANALDIFVDTYAKCGTTVGIKMIFKILEAKGMTSAGSNKKKLNDPWNAVPWIEVDVSQQLLSAPSPNDFLSLVEDAEKKKMPRLWKTHAPLNNFPCKVAGSNGSKILHIIRNPKDVVLSYFDFFKKEPMVNYRGDFDTLFDWFCDGSVVHSSFFEFELNWARARNSGVLGKDQLCIISYEDIVRRPKDVIKVVSDFIGCKLSEEEVLGVAEAIGFERSKKEASQNSDIAVIVNKGKIGRWREKLSKEQSDRIDRICNGRLRDAGLDFEFE